MRTPIVNLPDMRLAHRHVAAGEGVLACSVVHNLITACITMQHR